MTAAFPSYAQQCIMRDDMVCFVRRTILPPNTLPSLADKVDLAGDVRYDRGEQLMKKINCCVTDLQDQLSVEVTD